MDKERGIDTELPIHHSYRLLEHITIKIRRGMHKSHNNSNFFTTLRIQL